MSGGAERWLSFAQEYLQVAEIVLGARLYNQVCFHAQQCVEKSLKGVSAHLGLAAPRTHAIADLLRLLPVPWFANVADDLAGMESYYIPLRYPDALPGTLPDGLPGRAS